MLDILDQDIQFLPGVGPRRKALLDKELGIKTYEDLLEHYPYKYIDRRHIYRISELTPDACADAYISMGRLESTLALLDARQRDGAVVVNGAGGVALCCDRMSLVALFRSQGIPVPAESGPYGYWLKRAHGVAEGPMDVRFAANGCEAAMVKAEMQANGIAEVLQCAHVPGDLIKFYGVRGTAFFRHFYPGDDGITKFGDEQRNGRPCHYPFSVASLQAIAERAAGVAGVAGAAGMAGPPGHPPARRYSCRWKAGTPTAPPRSG